jgi:glycosyltransferase involved in cell wall biosynthesis
MLVFLSHYPEDATDVRDGMTQRIAAIDSIFKDVERVYLTISFRRHKRRRVRTEGLVRVETLNFYLHHKIIVRYLRRARSVYVHSVHNAIFVWPYFRYLRDRFVVDLHGIVPEETAFLGKRNWARILSQVEKSSISSSRLIIAVTQKMADHVARKYSASINPSRILVLPNVELYGQTPSLLRPEQSAHDGIRLIYAGTVGAWQNTDLMLQTLQRATAIHSNLHAYVYAHPESVAKLQEEVTRLHLNSRVTVGSLPHDKILKEYESADAGFVLRDDVLLNQVAMPTKLAEYMSHGVVPIVVSPDLGDFMRYGYRYLTIEDLYDADKLKPVALLEMRATNLRIMRSICNQAAEAQRVLKSVVSR